MGILIPFGRNSPIIAVSGKIHDNHAKLKRAIPKRKSLKGIGLLKCLEPDLGNRLERRVSTGLQWAFYFFPASLRTI
jgi:hypothetical protein